ncbi:Jag N-terminal domain-containing protein [Sulfurimonas sp.]|jgi:spoIIIJ-associated protein|uniref:Jag N-terminal domain-containing protein n=1 Tax=Sulfurimonas sp. TaxID=2022749 RepID=UPI0025D38648|nr:Jag N-terminal domain-containing protein [Sulfurimonas sp.]MBT5933867.1 protein jag [Sulfurimonas sp.]
MIKIEAQTLEIAYKDAATKFNCSVTELIIEVVQTPRSGILGMFKRTAIIVAVRETQVAETVKESTPAKIKEKPTMAAEQYLKKEEPKASKPPRSKKPFKQQEKQVKVEKIEEPEVILNDAIGPISFVSDQDDDDLGSGLDYTADYDDEFDETQDDGQETSSESLNINGIVKEVEVEINALFKFACFSIDKIEVSKYDDQTLLVEFKGDDAALLIGKEGYRYKALSYMIFNWINTKYDIQLRLEIAEFLKNQEESVGRYLQNVYENIEKDGRAQTKILDGVLVQIALKELREKYPQKYVVIRTTKDGLKYIIVNDYHNN